jgi:hypothetical protein
MSLPALSAPLTGVSFEGAVVVNVRFVPKGHSSAS